jgi:hypothetical protein
VVALGLDFDGVVADLRYLKKELGKDYLSEEELVSALEEELPPVAGVDKVFQLGVVKAIVTRRKYGRPIERWFKFWFGDVIVPVYCLGSVSSKADICKELGIRVFVDDDYLTVVDLIANGIKGLWFDVEQDKDLYKFLRREGVLD